MVRAVVGTLIEVGRGRLSLEDFKAVVAQKNRCAAGDSMPGNALSLVGIRYDNEVLMLIERDVRSERVCLRLFQKQD